MGYDGPQMLTGNAEFLGVARDAVADSAFLLPLVVRRHGDVNYVMVTYRVNTLVESCQPA